MITYRELLDQIKGMSEDHIDDHVTIFDVDEDEYYPALGSGVYIGDGVLDDGCHFITLTKEES